MKVYIPVFGSGTGHASRMAQVGEALQKGGIEVLFSSFHEGLTYLRSRGFRCEEVPSLNLGWNVFSIRQSIAGMPSFLITFAKQVIREIQIIRTFHPGVIISDSRLSSVIAGGLLQVPSLVVLNQLKILIPRRHVGPILSFMQNSTAEVLSYIWSFSQKILVPDLPPPYTISVANISGVRNSRKVRFVGFIFARPSYRDEELVKIRSSLGIAPGKPTIFVLISGPKPTRRRMIEIILPTAAKFASKINLVMSLGEAGADDHPKHHSWGVLFEWCPIRDEMMAMSDLVISRAGHETIAQCISFGKPMVLIPMDRHSEQQANARTASKLGVAAWLEEKEAEKELGSAIYSTLKDDAIKQRVAILRDVAAKYDGLQTVFQEVQGYLHSQ